MKKNRILNKALSLTALIALGSCGTDSFFNKEAKGPQEPKALIASIGDVITSGGNNEKPGFVAGILILRAGPKEGPFQKPCAGQTGKTHPDTGITGSCSGNNYIEIPLPTLNMRLSYNSLMAGNHNTGFGRKFSLSIDEQLYSNGTTNEYYLMQGDGTILPFYHSNDGEWSSSNPGTSPLVFERHTTGRMELFPGGEKAEFTTSTSDPNVYYMTKFLDKNGNATTITRSPSNKITKVTDPYGAAIDFFYTGENVTSIRDNAGSYYNLIYDTKNRLTSLVYPDGRKWEFNYDSGTNITKSTSANGETKEFTYYPYALASIKNALGYKSVYKYHKLGAVTSRTVFDVETEIFDSFGRMTSYNKNGKVSNFTRLENGLISSITDSIGNVTSFAYTTSYGLTDPRPTTINYPNGGGTLTRVYKADSRSGPKLQETLIKGNTKRVMTFDPWHGGLTSIVSGINGQDVANFEYDLKGNLLKEIRNGRTMATITRDAQGRALTYTDDLGMKTTYTYNAQGHLASRTDAFNRVSNYQTDALGNKIESATSTMIYTRGYNNMGAAYGTSTMKGLGAGSAELSTTKSISFHSNGAPSATTSVKKVGGITQGTSTSTYKTTPGQLHQRILTDINGQSFNLEQ